MGIRLKEEIRQCLLINALPKELKKQRLERGGTELTRLQDQTTIRTTVLPVSYTPGIGTG